MKFNPYPIYFILLLFIFLFCACNSIREDNLIKEKDNCNQSNYETLQYFEARMIGLNWGSIISREKFILAKKINQDSLELLVTQLFKTQQFSK